MYTDITFQSLHYSFNHKPLLIGGKAMEFYGLRRTGNDIDMVIHPDDHKKLKQIFPHNIKNIHGDIGICEHGFEIWNTICTFGYNYLKESAIENDDYFIISLEKLLFLKALAMKDIKNHKDLELIVQLVIKRAYGKA